MEILAQVWENTRMFSAALFKKGKYINKLCYVCVMECYVAIKKYDLYVLICRAIHALLTEGGERVGKTMYKNILMAVVLYVCVYTSSQSNGSYPSNCKQWQSL